MANFKVFRSLTARTLLAFSVFALVLLSLGLASFRYQDSLFDPNEFNQSLIQRAVLAVRMLEREPAAERDRATEPREFQRQRGQRDNRANERRAISRRPNIRRNENQRRNRLLLGSSSILLFPEASSLDKHALAPVEHKLGKAQTDFLNLLKTRISNRTRSRWIAAKFVEVDDDFISELLQINSAEDQAAAPRRSEDTGTQRFGAGFRDHRKRAFARALTRPVVLLQFRSQGTKQENTRSLLLLPAFTNQGFARLIIGLFVGTLLLAAFLTWYAIRSITRPLGLLTRSARLFGQSLTPAPVETRSSGEMKQAVQAFNTMQDQVKNLVDERTRIIGAVSHDLRTHLTRIRLRTQILADNAESNAQSSQSQEAYAAKTVSDLEDMERILEDSLEYTRFSTGEQVLGTEEIDLRDLLAHVTQSFDPPIPFHARTDFDASLIGNPTNLKRVFNNLLANAERHAEEPEVKLETVSTDPLHKLRITVLDKGPGIPIEERNRVLEPFYRLETSRNRETGGTGLGLAIANEIIAKHNGRLELKDRDDGHQGLQIEIRL